MEKKPCRVDDECSFRALTCSSKIVFPQAPQALHQSPGWTGRIMAAVRVLHILARLDRGGTETWLLNVFRHLNRSEFVCDCLVFDAARSNDIRGAYEAEVIATGCRVFRCPHPTNPWAFGRGLRRVLRSSGPYEIVHSHVDPCGFPLRWAHAAGIPTRIAHAHNPGLELRRRPLWVRRALSGWTRRLIARHATGGLATSQAAGEALFGRIRQPGWSWRVLSCGLDLSPYRAPVRAREMVLARLELPSSARVWLNVGKFCESGQKNQEFFLRALAEARREEPATWGVLVGDGPRRRRVEALADELGVKPYVRFLGSRDDVPELLLTIGDVFVFPSRFEGLGLAVVEAQAAGKPCVVSDAVPTEAVVVPELVDRLSLKSNPRVWARRINERLRSPAPRDPAADWRRIVESPFNISHAVQALHGYYRECVDEAARRLANSP